ncbi:MAG: hypothetical protein LBH13_10665 [Cellulomonadaceae bacterium]|jgi:hypothetical protein|nr:hypothetical protein [Cellulomonadaceae bacterium]
MTTTDMVHGTRTATVDRPVKHIKPVVKAGTGSSVDDTTYGRTCLDFGDVFGQPVPELAVASMAEQHDMVHRRAGKYHRRKVGWWATRERIVTATMEQELVPQPNGSFKPSGSWSNPVFEHHVPMKPPVRRIGDVRHDPSFTGTGNVPIGPPIPTNPSHDARNTEPTAAQKAAELTVRKLKKRYSNALNQTSYLPAAIRQSVAARAPIPTFYEAELLGHGQRPTKDRFTVRVCKMDEYEAIVIMAARIAGASTWQTEQLVFTFKDKPTTNASQRLTTTSRKNQIRG